MDSTPSSSLQVDEPVKPEGTAARQRRQSSFFCNRYSYLVYLLVAIMILLAVLLGVLLSRDNNSAYGQDSPSAAPVSFDILSCLWTFGNTRIKLPLIGTD